jgi:Fe-S cluster biogenesis protein NfuA
MIGIFASFQIIEKSVIPPLATPRGLLAGKKMKKEQVEAALNKVRPTLKADGGDIELVDVSDGVVQVRFTGACVGCPMAQMTLKQGVEKAIKAELPEVKEVINAYDYAAGGC